MIRPTVLAVSLVLLGVMPDAGRAAAPKAPPPKPSRTESAKPPARGGRAPKAPASKALPAKAAAARTADVKGPDEGPQTISYAGGVTAIRDLVYESLPGFRPLTLDLYLPHRGPKDYPKPLLIFIHGGSWLSGDARHGGGFDDFPQVLASLADTYVVASINYRLSGEARFPAQIQDVKTAVRWARVHAGDYGIDTTRIAVWGEEAGGELAGLAGTGCGVQMLEPPGAQEPSDCVQAVILWHGISDLATLAADSGRAPAPGSAPGPMPPAPTAEGAYLGCEPVQCPPGLVRNTSPIAFVSATSPPFLIQHGTGKDVPPIQSQKLYQALTDAHVPSSLVSYGPETADPGKASLERLRQFLAATFPKSDPAAPTAKPKNTALPY
jgi:acetyl esterase/lipase